MLDRSRQKQVSAFQSITVDFTGGDEMTTVSKLFKLCIHQTF